MESLAITVEFEGLVLLAGITDTSGIDLNGVIDDEIDGAERVDLGGIAAETLHGISHSSQVDDSRHATKIG